MKKDSRNRKWQITINNPIDHGYTHERIRELITEFSGINYWAMSDEIGEQKTYHTHIYISAENAIRFSTVKRRFEGAHFEIARGSGAENRDYIFKLGKWKNDKKHETNLAQTHEEYGVLPVERQGARNDIADLYDMIKQGMNNYQILEEAPERMMNLTQIEKVRQTVREEEYKNAFRELEITYISGSTATGKTRHVMEKYGYENVFRVTDYAHPFDSYHGQDVILFDEFASSFRIQDMLNYLDGYPLELPCRYANKVACYTKAYIISNIPLEQQYIFVQAEQPNLWAAFLRRIGKMIVFHDVGSYKEYSTADYFHMKQDEFQTIDSNGDLPFD